MPVLYEKCIKKYIYLKLKQMSKKQILNERYVTIQSIESEQCINNLKPVYELKRNLRKKSYKIILNKNSKYI